MKNIQIKKSLLLFFSFFFSSPTLSMKSYEMESRKVSLSSVQLPVGMEKSESYIRKERSKDFLTLSDTESYNKIIKNKKRRIIIIKKKNYHYNLQKKKSYRKNEKIRIIFKII